MKERFVFLFRPTKEVFDASDYGKAINKACSNCSSCSKSDDCELKNLPPLDRFCFAMPLPAFEDVKKVLPGSLINNADVVLLDLEKDLAYIYKGTGTLQEIKKGSFARMIHLYEAFANNGDTLFFEEIRDLRDVYLRDTYLNSQQSPLLN